MFVLGKKAASMPSGYHGGANLWAEAFRLIVEEETWNYQLLSEQFKLFKLCIYLHIKGTMKYLPDIKKCRRQCSTYGTILCDIFFGAMHELLP